MRTLLTPTPMPSRRSSSLTPAAVAVLLGGTTVAVLQRMEDEYTRTDTLTGRTVAAMYATYTAHTAALAWAGSRRIWPLRLAARPSRAAGAALAVGGTGIALAGAGPFGAGAQISGIEPGSLHATGIYRYSRNPQYLGLGLAATGAALASRSGFAGLLAAGVWTAYQRWIPSEERHLTRVFGNSYANYQARVGRWLSRPQPD